MLQLENSQEWIELQKQFQKLVQEAGVNIEEDDLDILEKEFGLTAQDMEELERDTIREMTSQKIFVKRIHPDAVLPEYAYPTDSGFDLFSVEEIQIPAFGRALIPTGLCFGFGENLELQIRPKSGLAINKGLTVLNTPGTVDSGYNGEVKVIIFNTNNHDVVITKGMKVAQACLCPVINGKYAMIKEVNELDEKDRGSNGFGSTGLGSIK